MKKTLPITIETPFATIIYRKDGIIHVNYIDRLLNLNETKEVFYATHNNSPWSQAPILLSGGDFTSVEKEAREFSNSDEVMNKCIAIAFISPSTGGKLMANFFIKFLKPKKPTRFFSTEEDAVKWLGSFKATPKK